MVITGPVVLSIYHNLILVNIFKGRCVGVSIRQNVKYDIK